MISCQRLLSRFQTFCQVNELPMVMDTVPSFLANTSISARSQLTYGSHLKAALNVRAELMAALQAVVKTTGPVCIYTDSEYVLKIVDKIQKWVVKDFVGIQHKDLWEKLAESLQGRHVLWR